VLGDRVAAQPLWKVIRGVGARRVEIAHGGLRWLHTGVGTGYRNQRKHFLVTGIVDPEPVGSPVVAVELEAVHFRRVRVLPWKELTDTSKWLRGWV